MKAFGAAIAGWCAVAAAQAPSHLESAALVGRVCEDLDGDGRCSSEEPGVPGARITLETGLTAIADAEGRYHLAALEARSPGVLGGVRLEPGRHRVGLDRRWLPPGTTATPPAATVELSLGAVLVQDFALAARPAAATGVARIQQAQLASSRVSVALAGTSVPGARLHLGAQTVEARGDGAWSLEVRLQPGAQTLTVVEERPDGLVRLEQRSLEVVATGKGAMLVPHEVRTVGEVQLPALRGEGASVALQGAPGAVIRLGAGEVRLDAAGRGAIGVPRGPLVLRWSEPGATAIEVVLSEDERPLVQALGLLDLELGLEFGNGQVVPRLNGRGAGMLRARVKGFDLLGDLDLRDADLVALGSGRGLALLEPRALDTFQRALDATRDPPGYGDSSFTTASNPGGQRLRLEVAREGLGFARLGNVRASFDGSELGRFHRAVSGGSLELRTPDDWAAGVRARAFGWSSEQELLSGLQHQPAHERFESTGGSLYWLSHGELVQGSEQVRIERRAAGTGLPLGELHLERGKDYQLDAASGRLWLAAPLALYSGAPVLGADELAGAGEQVLVVDYEYLATATADSAGGGGQLEGRFGPVTASAGAVREGRGYTLLRGQAAAVLGGYRIDGDLAHGAGDARGLTWSDSGGLEAAQ
ncbi:MAG: hypothetical protein K1X89_19920, partial [Myxococcaceae bacterium]|nr:hypothetical protein [Myxococcaceae bacterium]